jgi:hypothetical protein
MKPKLLITVGDSWTEGVGCYNNETPHLNTSFDSNFTKNLRETMVFEEKYQKNFHKQGWPNRVGKKLGFDKVINLGFGGASNSSCVKSFYNFLDDNHLDDYDVLVFWLMTEPFRFSFYIGGELQDYLPNTEIKNDFCDEYIKEIKDIEKDPISEQIFYIKVLESVCELRGFDLILSSWSRTLPALMKLYPSEKYLFKNPINLRPPYIKSKTGEFLIYHSFCKHPNEDGYEWMSNKIVSGIKENHSKWYSDIPNENLEWEWKSYRTLVTKSNSILI